MLLSSMFAAYTFEHTNVQLGVPVAAGTEGTESVVVVNTRYGPVGILYSSLG